MASEKKRSSSMMPDWSLLPGDLLHVISIHVDNCFDVVHARSVCSSWRSTFPFPSCLLHQSYSLTSFANFPLKKKGLCTLEKIPLLFLFGLRAPPDADTAWPSKYFLGCVGRDESEDHVELPSPLQCSLKVKIEGSDPTLMKMLDCQNLPLGHRYRMLGYKGAVAFLPLNKESEGEEFVVLMSYGYSHDLLVLRSDQMRCVRLKNISVSRCRTLVTFRGRFYATFNNGDIFIIDPYSLESTPLMPSYLRNEKYYLVPSDDELFLVEEKRGLIELRVSRLDEEAGKWVVVSDIGDRVLFIRHLGNTYLSCSTKELPDDCGLSGNSILFTVGSGNIGTTFKYQSNLKWI